MPSMSELLAAERNRVLELEAKLAEAKLIVTEYCKTALTSGMPYTSLRAIEREIHKL